MSRNTRIAAAISAPTLAYAQQEPPQPHESRSNLETVVVTGSAISSGVTKYRW